MPKITSVLTVFSPLATKVHSWLVKCKRGGKRKPPAVPMLQVSGRIRSATARTMNIMLLPRLH